MKLNRSARRKEKREHEEQIKEVCKLTPAQVRLVEKLANEKAEKMIDIISAITNRCYFNAMRDNKISESRANKIIQESEKLIDLESR